MRKKKELRSQDMYETNLADRWLETYLEKKRIDARLASLRQDIISLGWTSIRTSDEIVLTITRPGMRSAISMEAVRSLLSAEALNSCKRRHHFNGSVQIRKTK